jgi:predicted dehydrogenase
MMSLPNPVILDPASVPKLRWGVVSPGAIAETFVSSVHTHTTQRIVAVASRTPGKAEDFAKRHGITGVESSFLALVSRDDVDVVYISSYPSDHKEHALLAIAAGKHVLVEKPLALSAADAREVLDAGRAQGVLVMEAMWTRYLPQSTIIRTLLETAGLGSPQLFLGQFCVDNSHVERLRTPGGGGAVFDMGIYPIAMAQQFLGNPTGIRASGLVHESGEDQEAQVHLTYANGVRASLVISAVASAPQTVSCSFDNALITLDAPFLVPSGISLLTKDFYTEGEHWVDDTGVVGHEGLSYQATWLAHFVSQGLLESPVHTHDDTIAILAVCEEVVRQVTANPVEQPS